MNNRPKTIICDIDGTLFKHQGDICKQHLGDPILLSGARDRIRKWDREGCYIILITGRRESVRLATERQLSEFGIVHDQLIMGSGGGTRVLINDKKPDGEDSAQAICVERNKGLGDLEDNSGGVK